MKKAKSQEVDLLYKSEKKNKKDKKQKKQKKHDIENSENDSFNFDDEIVIGVNQQENKSKKDKKKKRKNKDKKNRDNNNTKTDKKEKKKSKKARVAKYSILVIIILGSIIAFFLSPIFDIKKITVTNNVKLSSDEIISLSGISTDKNMFKIRIGQVKKAIKENPYVESVEIKRILPSEIEITVNERFATYMIEYGSGVLYINNQGYMLEISEQRIETPIITGLTTPTDDFKPGNRLCKEDLIKLETVLKIMDTANSYEIGQLITQIGIADKNNYTLYLESERKTVYLGNASNINTRIMYLKEILEKEKGIESEIFINGDINKDDVYTREKV
ncbi:MAG: FtsQ-type POTRA domain-containing protein [Clostridia bacterium]|nr:FtsQ-type POTRA domain-containing protein [Clostridia bacterium]